MTDHFENEYGRKGRPNHNLNHNHLILINDLLLAKKMGNANVHGSSNKSFGYKSTAAEVANEYGQRALDKHIVITGSNCGLGFEAARVFASHGAKVVIACRNVQAGQEAADKIRKESPAADVEVRQLDLANLQSVRDFTKAYRESGRPLHILVNNAGVMACPKAFTKDGLEMQLGVNHMGHFLLTVGLLDVLKRSGTKQEPSRVLNLSSMANFLFSPAQGIRLDDLKGEKNYHIWERYGSSKLANILFTKELSNRLSAAGDNVVSVSLHPGVITDTNLMRHAGSIGPILSAFGALNGLPAFSTMISEGNKNIPQGAATTVFCALSPDIVPGEYYCDCQVSSKVHAKGKDMNLAKQLWDVSEQITGISWK